MEEVTADDLRDELAWTMDEWGRWLATLNSWSRRNQGLVVLSLCRILHTLECGRVSSKREAGEWALGALDAEWRGLIQQALVDRPDPWPKVRQPAAADTVERTLAFIDYGRSVARRFEETRRAAR